METWSYETRWTAVLRHIHFCSSVFYRQPAPVHDIASEAMSARSNIFLGQLALSQETFVAWREQKCLTWSIGTFTFEVLSSSRTFLLHSNYSDTTTSRSFVPHLSISNAAEHCGCRESFEREPSNMNRWDTFLARIRWLLTKKSIPSCESYCSNCLFLAPVGRNDAFRNVLRPL